MPTPLVPAQISVRRLVAEDRTAWNGLWESYLAFYREDLSAAVTDAVFPRLVAGEHGAAAFVAEQDDQLAGFVHVGEEWTTWSTASRLYLEDLFVSPSARGGGIGRALIAAVYEEADRRGSSSVYWQTEEFNAPARRLYETVATRKSWVIYER